MAIITWVETITMTTIMGMDTATIITTMITTMIITQRTRRVKRRRKWMMRTQS